MKYGIALALVLALTTTRGFAQQTDPVSNARVRLGPLGLSPSISLTNAGVDTNVFNDPTVQVPKDDFTVTVTPATDLWIHVGRALVSGTIKEDLVWYRQYESERGANTLLRLGVGVPMTRLFLNGTVSYLNTNDRPGFEIDARARRHEVTYEGIAEVLAFSRTFVGVRGQHQVFQFDEGEVFKDVLLRIQLNRGADALGVTLRYQVTALTGITFEVARLRDRFDYRPLGGSDSTTASVTVKFDPAALLKGSASVGFKDFSPDDPAISSYQGPTAHVNLTYVAAGATKVDFAILRDVQYSYDLNQPYYLQTSFTVSLAQQIFGPVDAVGRFGVQHLAYQSRVGVPVIGPDRTDVVRSYGFGAGYHFSQNSRAGFNADHDRRESLIAVRAYEGWRFGTTITYGF